MATLIKKLKGYARAIPGSSYVLGANSPPAAPAAPAPAPTAAPSTKPVISNLTQKYVKRKNGGIRHFAPPTRYPANANSREELEAMMAEYGFELSPEAQAEMDRRFASKGGKRRTRKVTRKSRKSRKASRRQAKRKTTRRH